jgi:L-alanine-DL-glutamate epimerase-like enolase superfamily enzyme
VLAEAHRIEMAPHNPQSDVSTLASMHVDATTPAATIQEYVVRKDAWVQDLFRGTNVRVKNGFAELPDRAGLGVELDEAVAARRPYKPITRQQPVFPDGSVADH